MNMALLCVRIVYVQFLKIQGVADQENIVKPVMKNEKRGLRNFEKESEKESQAESQA